MISLRQKAQFYLLEVFTLEERSPAVLLTQLQKARSKQLLKSWLPS